MPHEPQKLLCDVLDSCRFLESPQIGPEDAKDNVKGAG